MSKENFFLQKIVPAIIPDSSTALTRAVEELSFVHQLHIDIVDGKFVQSVSWPYCNTTPVADVKKVLEGHSIEVDLMVLDPIEQAKQWVEIEADMLVFHVEAISVSDFVHAVDYFHNCSIGISALNDTSFDTLKEYLKYADYVQIMGIAEIGAQGAQFDNRLFERIAQVQSHFPDLPISVDGSVNETTVQEINATGIDRCIVGSAIVKAADRMKAYKTLAALTSTR